MHNKDVCSPSSKSGRMRSNVNTAGRMQSNVGAFAISSSPMTNESLPPLAGNCSNDGSGSLYPDSVSGSEYDLPMKQKHPEKVEAMQHEIGQIGNVNKKLPKIKIRMPKSGTAPIKMHDKNVCSPSSKGGFGFSALTNENQPLTHEAPSKGPLTHEAPLKAPLSVSKTPKKQRTKAETGQSSKKSVTRTPKPWTVAETDVLDKALEQNPDMTVAELNSLPELKDRPRDSIKTKRKEHKTLPLSEATQRGKAWTTAEDDKLKAAYKDHGKDWPKLLQAVDGRTQKAVYDRLNKFAREKKVGEHEGPEMVEGSATVQKGSKTVDRSETVKLQQKGNEGTQTGQTKWADLMTVHIIPALQKLEEKIEENQNHITNVIRNEISTGFDSEAFKQLVIEAIAKAMHGGRNEKEK